MSGMRKAKITLMGKPVTLPKPKSKAWPLTPNDELISDSDGETTRKVLRHEAIFQNSRDATAKVKVTLLHQRRGNRAAATNQDWEDIDGVPLSKLHAGQKVRFSLNTTETKRLFLALTRLYRQVGTLNDILAEADLTIVDELDALVITGPLKEFITRWIQEEGEGFLELVEKVRPDIIATVYLRQEHLERREALAVFEQEMQRNLINEDGAWSEGDWESFFRKNTWIFGHGLAYQFLQELQGQAHYGGTQYTGKGAQRGDSLMTTSADIRFTVLVDIKRPDTPLLHNKPYRGNEGSNGVYRVSADLAGGVAQLQSNCATWYGKGSREEDAQRLKWTENIFTHEPKGILVIGSTAEFHEWFEDLDEGKLASFERFRRCLHNPEVLTFDELFERAKALVGETPADSRTPDLDDLPF